MNNTCDCLQVTQSAMLSMKLGGCQNQLFGLEFGWALLMGRLSRLIVGWYGANEMTLFDWLRINIMGYSLPRCPFMWTLCNDGCSLPNTGEEKKFAQGNMDYFLITR